MYSAGLRLSVEAKAKYISICRRLEHEERQDEVEGERESQDKLDLNSGKQSRPSKPLPDYSQLQRQAEKQQLKVRRDNLDRFSVTTTEWKGRAFHLVTSWNVK